MRISFTSPEIDRWLEALGNHFCTDSEDAIQQYEMIQKKLVNATIRSEASSGKIRSIRRAELKKQREHDDEVRGSLLLALRRTEK